MAKIFKDKKLVIASHNKGKIEEITDLLAPYKLEIKSGLDFDFDPPEETGESFLENARIKSDFFASKTKMAALADDSGLVIPELGGAPGIYSARWAGEDGNFERAMKRVEQTLIETSGKAVGKEAHFICALSLSWPNGDNESFEGRVDGNLTFPPKGNKGFGYDPIFTKLRYPVTFGEMELDEKQRLSHRADAFNKLIGACFQQKKSA